MKRVALASIVTQLLGTAVASAQPAPPAPTAPEPAPPPAPTAPEAAPPPPPPAPIAPPSPVPEDQPAPAEAASDASPEPPPDRLAVGKNGFFQPGLLAQGWFQLDRSEGATSSTFRLRRAELSVEGEIIPDTVGYKVMIDPAKVREFREVTIPGPTGDVTIRQPTSAISVLQDFFITFESTWADVSIGQFKIPVSWEGYNSSSKLILPERSFVSDAYGDARDLGVRITKKFPRWGYSAGVFNGNGLNQLDNNNQKDVALRLELYPVKGMTIAGVTYDSIGDRDQDGTKDRWEGDFRYERGPFLVQAEYIRARDVAGGSAITGHGAYGAFAYTLEPKVLGGTIQPVVRIGFLDPDTSQDVPADGDDELVQYDAGVNYYLRGNEMKLQASYQRAQFDDAAANNQVIVAAQVSY